VEANIGRSLVKLLMEHAVLMVSGFELAPGPVIFSVLDLHEMERQKAANGVLSAGLSGLCIGLQE